jgi:hypothetical protein
MIEHSFVAELQPTNISCTQTATAMLLSHYDAKYNVTHVLKDFPNMAHGSSMQELAIYCLNQGYKVEMHSFDARILDFTWGDLPDDLLANKLEKIKSVRDIDSLGKELTTQYIEQYIELVRKGGKLRIKPYPTRELLVQLIKEGPVCVALNYTTLLGSGHSKNVGLRKSEQDDLDNNVTTHAVLVYGQNADGNFLISDPWGKPQSNVVTSDQLISSIMAAQWLCDNILFRIVMPPDNPSSL